MIRLLFLISGIILFSSCSNNNVNEDAALKKYFDEYKVTGSFGLFDNGHGQFTIYDLPKFSDSTYLPASTFKIVNSLIGLETGVVRDDSAVIEWNGIPSSRALCDSNLTMREAFRRSCVPWYRELARRIGEKNMQRYLDSLGYAGKGGRFQIKNNLDTFWLSNAAKVTGDEQLGLVKKLYFEKLPFQKRAQSIVKKMMLWENNTNYQLAYKTGMGTTSKGTTIGWVIGWIEENQHPYFFSLMVESPDAAADIPTIRMNILKNILKQYGFMEGKK